MFANRKLYTPKSGPAETLAPTEGKQPKLEKRCSQTENLHTQEPPDGNPCTDRREATQAREAMFANRKIYTPKNRPTETLAPSEQLSFGRGRVCGEQKKEP